MKNQVSSFLVCVSNVEGTFAYSLFITESRSSVFALAKHLVSKSAAGVSVLVYAQSGALVARFAIVGGLLCNTFALVPRSRRRLSHTSFLYYLGCSRSYYGSFRF